MSEKKKSERLVSLDALRGFDMLWIMGGQKIIIGLAALTGWSVFEWSATQMDHSDWHGFAFYDMIFPLFLLIAGVSMPFSILKKKERGDDIKKIYYSVFKRLVMLVLLGMLYNRVHWFREGEIRYASVLARIGFGWFFAAIITLNSGKKWHYVWFAGILLAYWAILAFIPAPGFEAGDFTREGNLVGYIDRLILPGNIIHEQGYIDPLGLLSTLPAVSTALLGVITGHLLIDEKQGFTKLKKGIIIGIVGIVLIIIGKLWGEVFPINKKLWSSSFVVFSGGLSLILLSIFYLVIDVWGFKKWAFPFVVIGLNSITIYLGQPMLNFNNLVDFLFLGLFEHAPEIWVPFLNGICYTAICWLFLYILYKKKIFLKV